MISLPFKFLDRLPIEMERIMRIDGSAHVTKDLVEMSLCRIRHKP